MYENCCIIFTRLHEVCSHAIIWSNEGLVYWRICMSRILDEFKAVRKNANHDIMHIFKKRKFNVKWE